MTNTSARKALQAAYAPIPTERPGVTMSFRAFADHAGLIHDAARAKGVSAASFMRKVVLEWAAAELGESTPDMGRYAHTDQVAEAAKLAGMTPRDFITHAAREAATAMLAKIVTERPAVRPASEPPPPPMRDTEAPQMRVAGEVRRTSETRRRVG